MCGTQSAESASMGGTIRTLEKALTEARATIADLTDEVARLRVLQRAFTWETNCRCQPTDKTCWRNSPRECGGTPSPPLASGRQSVDCD